MKQLTPEILESIVTEMGYTAKDFNEENWEWHTLTRNLIEELNGRMLLSYGAEIKTGDDYADLTLYVGTDTPVGWVCVTFSHDFTPMGEADIVWKDFCEELLYQEGRAKKIKAYFATEKDQTPAPTQLNA